ncbi:lipopolysaccharide biosynthesis protein [Actinotalea sp. C106]|uniref:lipopolysaccharide biosynthesis protein n=1 Tax=Actinotalea sp. C106 TaxID=2908644 RepID=UPI0020295062|nr:lipopolysaccharide biosynthesis protein [Actinotalea sp. C106]
MTRRTRATDPNLSAETGAVPNDHVPPDEEVSTGTLASGTRWMVVGRLVTQASRFLVSIILARLLTPEAFGIVAVAMTTILALEVLKDLGTGSALIQRASVDQRLISSVFYLNIAMGVLSAGIMALGAPFIAGVFGSPDAAPVVRALSLVLLIGGLSQTHHAILRRRMNFNAVAAIDMTGALTTGIVSIALAVAGLGVWAMVWGNVAGVVAGTVVALLRSGWQPSATFSPAALRSIAAFSLNTAAFNLTTFVLRNSDKVLVGRWLGASPLGIYTLAQRTISYPVESIAQVLMTVLFPAFSRLQDDHEALRNGYLRALGAIAFVTLPVMVGAAAVATPLVHTVFGDQWLDLIPLLWFMAPAGALAALMSAINTLYSAKGRADWMFRWGLASGAFTLLAFAVGLQWGLLGLAIAYLVAMTVQTPVGLAVAGSLIELPLGRVLRTLTPYLLMTMTMAAGAWSTATWIESTGASHPLALAAAVGVGALLYGGTALLLRPPAVKDVARIVTSRRGGGA